MIVEHLRFGYRRCDEQLRPARVLLAGGTALDGVLDGSWGSWAIEVKTGPFGAPELRGLLEFARRFPKYRPLLLCDAAQLQVADRLGVEAIPWKQFLLSSPPGAPGAP